MSIGAKIWAIGDGFIPNRSNGPEPEMTSHESLCILNAGLVPAEIDIEVFFQDIEPYGPYRITVPARRVHHQRMNDLTDPTIPLGVDYSVVVRSNEPIVVQHTRVDTRQEANAIFSTMGHPCARP